MGPVSATLALASIGIVLAEDAHIPACCTCDECDGCSAPGRRLAPAWLSPSRQTWAAADCCNLCTRRGPAGGAALRTVPPAQGMPGSTIVVRANPQSNREGADGHHRPDGHHPLPPSHALPQLRHQIPPSISETPQTGAVDSLEVVLCRSQRSRGLFRKMVSGFEMDANDRMKWSPTAFNIWRLFKSEMQLDKTQTSSQETPRSYMHSKLFDVERDASIDAMPLLAMRGGTPCAAATFSDANQNEHNSYELLQIISNAGPGCKGGGAALLCHLIRNSKDKSMNYSPLKVLPNPNDPLSKRWFESFGCKEPHPVLRILDDITGYMPLTSGPAVCEDPSPKKCAKYDDIALDADGYFGQIRSGSDSSWNLSEPAQSKVISIPLTGLIGLFVGCGATLALFRSRRGVMTIDERPFLAA